MSFTNRGFDTNPEDKTKTDEQIRTHWKQPTPPPDYNKVLQGETGFSEMEVLPN